MKVFKVYLRVLNTGKIIHINVYILSEVRSQFLKLPDSLAYNKDVSTSSCMTPSTDCGREATDDDLETCFLTQGIANFNFFTIIFLLISSLKRHVYVRDQC